jgi:diadenosine tetraphosphate (Ap4A) HIT family hydrolase
MTCLLCDRIKLTAEKKYPYLIKEFKHSFLMLGEHQFFSGYSVLVLKHHYREMTDIPSPMREEFFQEMMDSSRIVSDHFRPKKMNMCSLGNRVDHIHWHFFPRYADDPHFFDPPWLRMHLFDGALITPEEARVIIGQIAQSLATC